MNGKNWIPFIIVIVSVLLLQFGVIFLFLAMLPAGMSWFVDRDKGKPTFKTVAACNFAATLPSIAPIVQSTFRMSHYDIVPLMGDPANWMYIYSGAAAGWGLIYLCRFIARFIVTLMFEFQINSLEHNQERLIEEWGQQILHPIGEKSTDR